MVFPLKRQAFPPKRGDADMGRWNGNFSLPELAWAPLSLPTSLDIFLICRNPCHQAEGKDILIKGLVDPRSLSMWCVVMHRNVPPLSLFPTSWHIPHTPAAAYGIKVWDSVKSPASGSRKVSQPINQSINVCHHINLGSRTGIRAHKGRCMAGTEVGRRQGNKSL